MNFFSSVDQHISSERESGRDINGRDEKLIFVFPSISFIILLVYLSRCICYPKNLPPKTVLTHDAKPGRIDTFEITLNHLTCEIIVFITGGKSSM